MMKKQIYCLGILLFFMFFSGNMRAAIRTVSDTDGGKTVEGSLGYEMTYMTSGDTLLFDAGLADQTIILTTSINRQGDITIIGNGVTITSSKDIDFNLSSGNVTLENICFRDFYGLIVFKTPSIVNNCTFISTANTTYETLIYVNKTADNTLFKGCAFISESTAGSKDLLFIDSNGTSNQAQRVSFVSCTFIRNQAKNKPFIKWTSSNSEHIKNFTNCIFIDPNSSGTNSTISIPKENLVFSGYNVIQGSINGSWTGVDNNHSTDKIVAKDAASPLFKEDGIYKVVVDDGSGPAYKLLPANPEVEGVSFPKYDLAGNEIDYTKATHAGAWQALYGDEPTGTVYPTQVSITGATEGQVVICDVLGESKTLKLKASVLPNDCDQEVEWSSSNTDIATIDEDGNVTIPFTADSGDKTVTFTASTKALKEDGDPLTASISITVKPYVYVESFVFAAQIDTIRSLRNKSFLLETMLSPTVMPESTINKNYTWSIDNEEVGTLSYDTYNKGWKLQGNKAGEVTVKAIMEENPLLADSCVFVFHDPYYSDVKGAFLLTEGTYPATGGIHFINEETGVWDKDIETVSGTSLGVTTQFATIYGDHFYFVSKQESRLVVMGKETLDYKKSFKYINDSGGKRVDGRAFLGVDENTGYVGTSGGIAVVKFDELLAADGSNKSVEELPFTEISGATAEGTEGNNDLDPGLYKGQVGTMRRVGDRVFAIQQGAGILVINALTHTLEAILEGNYSNLVLSKDGYLWSGTSEHASGSLEDDTPSNIIDRIDPYSLEVKHILLPSGYNGPSPTWGAWQADVFCASAQTNHLYWTNSVSGFGGGDKIYQYDIESNTIKIVWNGETHPRHPSYPDVAWKTYGCPFRIHPETDELYIANTLWTIDQKIGEWHTIKVNPHTAEYINLNVPSATAVFSALWIFPDNHAPVISDNFTDVSIREETRIYLGDLVTDVDNMDAAIIKSVLPDYDDELISTRVWRDSLYITPIKALAEEESTSLTLKANSNGQVVTKSITITVDATVEPAIPVTGVTLNHTTAELKVGETLQLRATVAPDNADNKAVTWTSNKPDIASVSSAGLITAHAAPGTAVITVTTADGSHTARCTVTTLQTGGGTEINPFELTQKALSLFPNQTVTLALTAPQHFNVTWSSSNSSVVTVSSSGEVRSVAAGTAYIIARDVEQGKSDICIVTVTNLPTIPESITLNTSLLSLMEGETTTLTTTLSSGLTGKTITWSSSDKAVADVTSGGLVIAVAPGTCVIKATIGTCEATCIIVVSAYSGDASVTGITQNEAFLHLPVHSGASYYLIHLYRKTGNRLEPQYTLKVTPDGHVSLLRSAETTLSIHLNYLEPGTFYTADIETIRETNGKAEIIQTKTAGFTTRGTPPTDIESIPSPAAKVWYFNGTLHLENLNGHTVRLIRLSGQSLAILRPGTDHETCRRKLSPGIYILTAEKDGHRKTFKIPVP